MKTGLDLYPVPREIVYLDGEYSASPASVEDELPVEWDDRLPPEGYRLQIRPDKIGIHAASQSGAYYAGQTWRQIRAQCTDALPCVDITDWPDFPQRGLMLDVSRCKVPTLETLADLIDWMASIKLNQLQLYIEHTFAFPGYERVWAEASPYTAEEIREIDAYCRERHVELVPNLNSFGHMERWLRHPSFRHLAECPEGFVHPVSGRKHDHGSTLFPGPESLAFLEELYDAYLPCFGSRIFNVGGDEPWELGRGRSRSRVEAVGKGRVYLDFLSAIHQRVTARGFRMQCWADILLEHEDLIPEVPKDFIPVIWGYSADFDFERACRLVSTRCPDFLVAPGNNAWGSFTGRLDEALGNMNNATRAGRKAGAVGCLITSWGDDGNHQPWITLYPGVLAGACSAWGTKANQAIDLEKYFDRQLFPDSRIGSLITRLGRLENHLPAPEPANPSWRSATHLYLFREPEELRQTLDVRGTIPDKTALERFITAARELEADAGALEPAEAATALALREIRLGARMARAGALRALWILHGVRDIDWAAEVREFVPEFRDLWLQRARPGGLAESLSLLENIPGLKGTA